MGSFITLTAADGHRLGAYRAEPEGEALGGVVVVQEIFGITEHIQRVVREWAGAGYAAIAPAMFDRIKSGIVLEYTQLQEGIGYMQQLQPANTLADVKAALDAVRVGAGTVVVGFCWGGTVAHIAASELPIQAAVSYYGGGVVRNLDKPPRCPIIYHFGDQDHSIPVGDIRKIEKAHPDGTFHVYPGAGHGFNCEDRQSFSASDARLAFGRSLAFVREHVG